MASSLLLHTQITLILLLISLTCSSRADAPLTDPSMELDWHSSSISTYDAIDQIEIDNDDDISTVSAGRRSLFWKRMRYYISYGALSANRVPCPPRSGRSYYTHDCWRARGPVHPYTRGCSAITRCRR